MNGDGVHDGNDEWEDGAIIDYTTGEIATPIDNKGCLIMFDELLDVDMDEISFKGDRLTTFNKNKGLVHFRYTREMD